MMTSRLVVSLIVHDLATDRLAALQFGERSWAPEPLWTLPGGKVEPGERVDHAAAREAFEETGLVCRPQHLQLVHTIHVGRGRDGRGQFLALTFATTRWEGQLVNVEPGKHLRAEWVDLAHLPTPMYPTAASSIQAYRDGGPAFDAAEWE